MNYLDRKRFVPVSYFEPDIYRVAVWVNDDDICVCVAPDTFRYYSDDSLPRELKQILTMAKAFPKVPRPSWAVNPSSAYTPMDVKHREIGWHVCDDLYILVMRRELLEQLFVGATHDP
jgi:hypothetical protein